MGFVASSLDKRFLPAEFGHPSICTSAGKDPSLPSASAIGDLKRYLPQCVELSQACSPIRLPEMPLAHIEKDFLAPNRSRMEAMLSTPRKA